MNFQQEIEYLNIRFSNIGSVSGIEMQLLASEVVQYILNSSNGIIDSVELIYHLQERMNGKYEILEEIMRTFRNKSHTGEIVEIIDGKIDISKRE